MSAKKFIVLFLCILMALPSISALSEGFAPLPMDDVSFGPKPKDENYLSNQEYQDESISVKIYEGRYADTDYFCAHVKISHPSQLRTIPASIYNTPKASFVARASEANFKGRLVANKVNAVVAINGDFYTKTDMVKVVLRQGKQVRNISTGASDLLIIDMNGDFSYLPLCSKEDYQAYYEANQQNMYQVFCFGPVLVENGTSRIDEEYLNKSIGSQNNAQRSAIAQLGPLEYMLITCGSKDADKSIKNKGLTIFEFAALCEMMGKELNENGCQIAYNLDGGNSSALVFKEKNTKTGKLSYVKYNYPNNERFLGDIIYFATLVK